jgi:hypothetical protein
MLLTKFKRAIIPLRSVTNNDARGIRDVSKADARQTADLEGLIDKTMLLTCRG